MKNILVRLKILGFLFCLLSTVAVANAQQSLLLNYHNSAGFSFSRTQSFYLTVSFYHAQYGTSGGGGYFPIAVKKSGTTVASFDWRSLLPANPCTSVRYGPFAAGSYTVGGGAWYFYSGAFYVITGDGQANTLVVQ